MATNESSPRRSSALDTITNLFAIALVLVVGWLAWPYLVAQFQARSAPMVLPTAVVPHMSGNGAGQVTIDDPRPAVNVEATSAAYNATEQARAVPQPNVNTTGDSAPLVREQKAVEVAPASAGVVPTSEPINGNFGSKQIAPINIQATHQCLHAQIWTDTGCHNPTPVQ